MCDDCEEYGDCVSCGNKLLFSDAHPNGDMSPVCAQCEAEQDHDFDAEPNVVYNRYGRRV